MLKCSSIRSEIYPNNISIDSLANSVTLLSKDQNRVLHFVKYYKSDSQLQWITLIYAIQIFWQIESKEKLMFNENVIANL